MCSRGHWRPSEDEKLRELVESYGPHNWNAIAENLRGRSGKINDHILNYSNYSIQLKITNSRKNISTTIKYVYKKMIAYLTLR